MLSVVATLQIKEGKEEEFEGVMRELAEKTRANEPGCQLYSLHRSKHPQTYVVLERYDDQDAFKAHAASEHFRTISPKLGPCFDGPPKIDVLTEVD